MDDYEIDEIASEFAAKVVFAIIFGVGALTVLVYAAVFTDLFYQTILYMGIAVCALVILYYTYRLAYNYAYNRYKGQYDKPHQ